MDRPAKRACDMAFLKDLEEGMRRARPRRYEWKYAWHQNGRLVAGPLYYTSIEAGKIAAEAAISRFDLMGVRCRYCKLTLLERHVI